MLILCSYILLSVFTHITNTIVCKLHRLLWVEKKISPQNDPEILKAAHHCYGGL